MYFTSRKIHQQKSLQLPTNTVPFPELCLPLTLSWRRDRLRLVSVAWKGGMCQEEEMARPLRSCSPGFRPRVGSSWTMLELTSVHYTGLVIVTLQILVSVMQAYQKSIHLFRTSQIFVLKGCLKKNLKWFHDYLKFNLLRASLVNSFKGGGHL